MHPEMRHTSLIEDVNRLACAELLDSVADDTERARTTLERMRWIDTTDLEHYRGRGWLSAQEADLIERFTSFARARLVKVPNGADPIRFTRGDPGWQAVRERAIELLEALDGFVDIGVPGWRHQRV